MNPKNSNIYGDMPYISADMIKARNLNVGLLSSNLIPSTLLQSLGSILFPYLNLYVQNIKNTNLTTEVITADELKVDKITKNLTNRIDMDNNKLINISEIENVDSNLILDVLSIIPNSTLSFGNVDNKLLNLYLTNLYINTIKSSLIPDSSQLDLGDINHYFKYGYIQHLKIDDISSSTQLPIVLDKLAITNTLTVSDAIGTSSITECTIPTLHSTDFDCSSATIGNLIVGSQTYTNITVSGLTKTATLQIDEYLNSNITLNIDNIYSLGIIGKRFKDLYITNVYDDNLTVTNSITLPNNSITYNKLSIASGDIIGDKILSIPATKLSTQIIDGNLDNNSITGLKIKDTTITYAKLNLTDGDIAIVKINSSAGTGTKFLTDTTPPTWAAVNTDLTNISTNVIPATADTFDLGSALLNWKRLYISSIYLYRLYPWGTEIALYGKIVPDSTNSQDIGSSSKLFANAYATHFRGSYSTLAYQIYVPLISGTGANNTVRIDCSICPTTDLNKNLGNITTTNNRFLNGYIQNVNTDYIRPLVNSNITAYCDILPDNPANGIQSIGASSKPWNVYGNTISSPIVYVDRLYEKTYGNSIMLYNNLIANGTRNIGDSTTGKINEIHTSALKCDCLYASKLYQTLDMFADATYNIGSELLRINKLYSVDTYTTTLKNPNFDIEFDCATIAIKNNEFSNIGTTLKHMYDIFTKYISMDFIHGLTDTNYVTMCSHLKFNDNNTLNIGTVDVRPANIYANNIITGAFCNNHGLNYFLRDDMTWQTPSSSIGTQLVLSSDTAFIKMNLTDLTPQVIIDNNTGSPNIKIYRDYNSTPASASFLELGQNGVSYCPGITANTPSSYMDTVDKRLRQDHHLFNVDGQIVGPVWVTGNQNYNNAIYQIWSYNSGWGSFHTPFGMVDNSSGAYYKVFMTNVQWNRAAFTTYSYSTIFGAYGGAGNAGSISASWNTFCDRKLKKNINVRDYNHRIKILGASIKKNRFPVNIYKYTPVNEAKGDENNKLNIHPDDEVNFLADEWHLKKNEMFSNLDENDFEYKCTGAISTTSTLSYCILSLRDLYENKYKKNCVKNKEYKIDIDKLNNRVALLEINFQKSHEQNTDLINQNKILRSQNNKLLKAIQAMEQRINDINIIVNTTKKGDSSEDEKILYKEDKN